MNNYNDEYQEIFEATCCLLKTFNGKDGKAIVQEVNEIMDRSSAMRRSASPSPRRLSHGYAIKTP